MSGQIRYTNSYFIVTIQLYNILQLSLHKTENNITTETNEHADGCQ